MDDDVASKFMGGNSTWSTITGCGSRTFHVCCTLAEDTSQLKEALLSYSVEVRAVESFYELSAHRLRVGHASCVQHGVQVAMQMLL